MPLRRKVPLTIISLTSIPLILLSIFLYSYISSRLIQLSEGRVKELADLQWNGLDQLIREQKKHVQLIARINEMKEVLKAVDGKADSLKIERLREQANDILSEELRESQDFQTISLINVYGKVIASGNRDAINIDVSDRKYYQEAMKGIIAVSNIHDSKLYGEKVVDIASPVRDSNNKIIGLVTNSINVDYFRKYADNIRIGDTGYAYIVDSEGIVVAHPEDLKIGKPVENAEIRKIIDKIIINREDREGTGTYIYKGKEKYMAYHMIGDFKWLLVVAQDKSEMKEIANTVFIIISFVTVILLILSLIIGAHFSQSITKPIKELTAAMDKAAEGDFTAESNLDRKDEFGQLSNNFNVMLQKLNMSHEELTALYEQLAAAEEELRAQYEELQANEESLRNSEERYRLAVNGANNVIWEWNINTKEFFASEKWEQTTGYPVPTEIDIIGFSSIIFEEDVEIAIGDLMEHLEGRTDFYRSEFRIKTKNNDYKWVVNRGEVIRDSENRPIRMAGSLTDITERKENEKQIKFMAYYDILTGLPNRTLFMKNLDKELIKARNNGATGAVLFIDLDNFKNINDTLGHDYGDRLLELIANRLNSKDSKDYSICRFGGDEFIILKPGVNNEENGAVFAEKILEEFNEPFQINDRHIDATVSIGIAIYPMDGFEGNTILKNADAAMYRAKKGGKNRYAFFNKEMHDDLQRKEKINSILKQAIKNNEFELHYQPQYNIKLGSISGFEVLIRLYNKDLGYIPPNEFIPLAEESGLINEIGRWCLYTACKKNKEWMDKGYNYDCISVNISPIQLQQSNFLQGVKEILKNTGLKPEYLCIEITETALMERLEENISILNELRYMGVKIALDDFGTGYSSLNYLRKMPINTLKMDKTFIDGICSSLKEEAIADGIIHMAHKIDLEVVAEGVETEEQLRLLKDKNCDKVQGYLLSKPLTEKKAEELLIRNSDEVQRMASATLDY